MTDMHAHNPLIPLPWSFGLATIKMQGEVVHPDETDLWSRTPLSDDDYIIQALCYLMATGHVETQFARGEALGLVA